jgi:hypothetical protein
VFDELYNYGFPQEMQHFARCVRGKESCICEGDVGLVVQQVLAAGYASHGLGQRINMADFAPRGVSHPIKLWKEKGLAEQFLIRR